MTKYPLNARDFAWLLAVALLGSYWGLEHAYLNDARYELENTKRDRQHWKETSETLAVELAECKGIPLPGKPGIVIRASER